MSSDLIRDPRRQGGGPKTQISASWKLAEFSYEHSVPINIICSFVTV